MNKKLLGFLFVPALVIGAAGCTVEQTEEGELPEVNVEGGELPEYDVDPADVDIEGEERTIEVPTDVDVETEERTITVPDIDVQPANE